ncbi:MAG: purine-nucleoside phosphorylase, partial [Myxococcaceae bacterium]
MKPPLFDQLTETLAALAAQTLGARPKLGFILGSGLGGFVDRFENARAIPYTAIPHFPSVSVPGHAGRLVTGTLGGVPVVALSGRAHLYEGHSPAEVAYPARVLCRWGISALVVTNASGGVRQDLKPGTLMRITDHLNLSGSHPLMGPNDTRLGPRFPDVSRVYDAALAKAADEAAKRVDVVLAKGVYAQLSGPTYETPAEVRMLRILGADAVGMSTVPEVLVAAHQGVPVMGVSCITNAAVQEGSEPLSHEDVAHVAQAAAGTLSNLLVQFVPLAIRALGH